MTLKPLQLALIQLLLYRLIIIIILHNIVTHQMPICFWLQYFIVTAEGFCVDMYHILFIMLSHLYLKCLWWFPDIYGYFLIRGVQNPMKISDISFLKTEPVWTYLKIQKLKSQFPQFGFQKPTSVIWGRFFTLSHLQFIFQHDTINS